MISEHGKVAPIANRSTPLRAAVFDLDDTLIATARARRRAYEALRPFGVEPRAAQAANTYWWNRYYRGECSLEEMRQGRWVDLGLSPEDAQIVDGRYRGHYAGIRSRQGTRAMLEQLAAAGVQLVLLSNAGIEYVRERAATLGIEPLLAGIVDVADTGYKPNLRAFQTALELAGCMPEEAAMVGDDLEADVEGALQAGFGQAIWLSRRRPHPDPRVYTVPSVPAASAYLLRLATHADPTL